MVWGKMKSKLFKMQFREYTCTKTILQHRTHDIVSSQRMKKTKSKSNPVRNSGNLMNNFNWKNFFEQNNTKRGQQNAVKVKQNGNEKTTEHKQTAKMAVANGNARNQGNGNGNQGNENGNQGNPGTYGNGRGNRLRRATGWLWKTF